MGRVSGATILIGDVRERLRDLPDGSVQCVVTSPPYFGLRDYGVDGQIGLEPTPAAFVAALVEVFREVRRVLRDDGTCWVNLGDSYAAQRGGTHMPAQTVAGGLSGKGDVTAFRGMGGEDRGAAHRNASAIGLKHKDLIGIPWRVAFALQEDGWWLRSDIIWAKPNPVPESVTDRPTKAHEYLFLLTKRATYYYDAAAIAEPSVRPGDVQTFGGAKALQSVIPDGDPRSRNGSEQWGRTVECSATRNKRSVWTVATQPYAEAHFATYPEKLIEPCILAGTSQHGACPACDAPWRRVVERGELAGEAVIQQTERPAAAARGVSSTSALRTNGRTYRERHEIGWEPSCSCGEPDTVPCVVLDPFCGSGTTGVVALRHGRSFVGVELSPEYARLAERRITGDAPLFNTVSLAQREAAD